MTKNATDKSERAARREARRAASSDVPYKMRSAASRRAEARARADYRGAGEDDAPMPGMTVRDVGIRVNLDEPPPRPRKKEGELDAAQIAHLLHNPTKVVPVEVLRAQYSYVAADIRSMALLAAGLFALLVVLAFVLPQ